MATRDIIQAAAGVGGSENLYVEDVFSTYLYTGNGSTQTITNGIDLAGEGGLVWIKDRNSGAKGHALFDTERGGDYKLQSQSFNGQFYATNQITSFNSNGFSLGSAGDPNGSGTTYASWTFRKAPKFFDVVTWTGDGTDFRTVNHSLGTTPGMVIIKNTTTSSNWFVWHRSLSSATKVLFLNLTNAESNYSNRFNPSPSSTDIGLGYYSAGATEFNAPGNTYVAYLFAHDAGGFGDDGTENVISCGSFTYPVSGDVEINLGWEPQWLLTKRVDSTGGWWLIDNMRGWGAQKTSGTLTNSTGGPFNALFADLTNAEAAYQYGGLTSTGFKFPSNLNAGTGNTKYIYIAIRRGPMKTPTSGTEVFSPMTRAGTGSAVTISGIGFSPDMLLSEKRSSPEGFITNRLAGFSNTSAKYLYTPYSVMESALSTVTSGIILDGATTGTVSITTGNANLNQSPYNYVDYFFRRAPGFFDVVCYTTNSGTITFNHNLGVSPELIIFKARNTGSNWWVYSSTLGGDKRLALNADIAPGTYVNGFVLSVSSTAVETSSTSFAYPYNEIAYLFATLPGVSKVGSYTGTGTTKQIDCGFSSGARFVLIKRTDSTGDWYVWDSARGIVAGNDPYLFLNSTAAEVTTTDYINPYSAGFEISSLAPAAINASGGTYIFLAIA